MRKRLLVGLALGGIFVAGGAQAWDPIPSKLKVVVNPGADGEESVEFRLQLPPTVERRHNPQREVVLGNPAAGETENGVMDLSGEVDFKEVLKKNPTALDEVIAGPKEERARTEELPESFASELVFVLGGSNDDLHFTIAGGDGSPNVISELTWTDVRSVKAGLDYRWMGQSQLVLTGTALFGSVVSGSNEDSDYNGDDRTQIYSRSNSDTSHGSSFDGRIGVGWAFDFPLDGGEDLFRLTPTAGFSAYTQHVKDSNGYQEYSSDGTTGYFEEDDEYNKTFDTEWYGPWIGVEAEYHHSEHHVLRADVAFHYFKVQAEGNWILRDDLDNPVSFDEDVDGYGWELGLSYIWRPWSRWFVDFGLHYRRFDTGSGFITFYGSDGSTGTQRLNGIDTEGVNFLMGIGYRF